MSGRLVAIALAAAALSLGAGCAADPTAGYSAGGVYAADVATIAVPIFENRTYERDVEFELTDALIKEIEARTPYKVTPASRADSMLSGRIVSVERDQLSRSRVTGLSEEVILSVTIDFQWRNLRTGEVLAERRSFTHGSLFVPSTPVGDRAEIGQFGAVQKAARSIVNEMQAVW